MKFMSKESKKINFTQLFKELEEITAWFEREEVDLEEGLKKFERGLELAKLLKDHLRKVENKVNEIKAKFDQAEIGSDEKSDEEKVKNVTLDF